MLFNFAFLKLVVLYTTASEEDSLDAVVYNTTRIPEFQDFVKSQTIT